MDMITIYLADKKRITPKVFMTELFTTKRTITPQNNLMDLNDYDYTCIQFKDGYRKEENFETADCILLDFDHLIDTPDFDVLPDKIHEIMDATPYEYYALPSSSQCGFHAIVPLASSINDVNQYKQACENLVGSFPMADQQVKDGARFAFGTCISTIKFLRQCVVREGISYDPVKALEHAKQQQHQYVQPTHDVYFSEDYDVTSEGSRNVNCHKLACRLLNQYPEDEAYTIFMQKTDGNGLSEKELESTFRSAKRSMLDQGMAYTTPERREENRQIRQEAMYENPESSLYEAIAPNDTPVANPQQSAFQQLVRKNKPIFARFYQNSGLKKGLKNFERYVKNEYSEDMATADLLAHMAEERWAYEITPSLISDILQKYGYQVGDKSYNAIIDAVTKHNLSTDEAVAYIPQLTGWFAYNRNTGKWDTSIEKDCTDTLKKDLDTLYQLTNNDSLPVIDDNLTTGIRMAKNDRTLSRNLHASASLSYDRFSQGLEYSIPCPQIVYTLSPDGRTLSKKQSSPSQYILEQFKVAPSFADMPVFNSFLSQIVPDKDDRDWMQVALGSQILGIVPADQSFYMWIGEKGANGKSTLFNAISDICGNYAHAIDPSTFSDKLSTVEAEHSRAEFMGKRVVIAQEGSQNIVMSGSQIKAVCSSDEITASRKYVNKFTFKPTHHVNLIANHEPHLENAQDGGVARRIKEFKFEVSIPESQRDADLSEKLKNEYPQILGWLIQGAMKFLQNGKKLPYNAHVEKWTNEFLSGEDQVQAFVDDVLVTDKENPNIGKTDMVGSKELYNLYEIFCQHHPTAQKLSQKAFSQQVSKVLNQETVKRTLRTTGKEARVWTGVMIDQENSMVWKQASNKYRDGIPMENYTEDEFKAIDHDIDDKGRL